MSAERPAAWRRDPLRRSWSGWCYLWPLAILAYYIDRRVSK